MALTDQPAPFTPRYSLRLKFALVIIPLLSVSVVEKMVSGGGRGDALAYFSVFVVLLLTAFVPITLIRRVRFERELVVDRFLLPPQTIPYKNVKDVGLLVVKVEGGLNIPLSGVKNAGEFLDKLAHALAQRNLIEQLEGKLAAREFRTWQSTSYAAVVTPLLFLLVWFFGPSWFRSAGEFTLVLIYIGLFVLVQVVADRVTRSE